MSTNLHPYLVYKVCVVYLLLQGFKQNESYLEFLPLEEHLRKSCVACGDIISGNRALQRVLRVVRRKKQFWLEAS